MPWIHTLRFRKFTIDPDFVGPFDIRDIATSLSRTPRFRGFTLTMFNVASHSINVANLVKEVGADHNVVRAALLHDSAEAYLSDVPKPFKLALPDYMELEEYTLEMLAQHYEFPYPLPDIVHDADRVMTAIEASKLLRHYDANAFACLPDYLEMFPISDYLYKDKSLYSASGKIAVSKFLRAFHKTMRDPDHAAELTENGAW